MPDTFQAEVIDRLARIEQRLSDRDAMCGLHSREIRELQKGLGKQGLVAASIGAVGTALVLATKALLGVFEKGAG